MTTATTTSKGQITIPAIVRQSLNVGAGDRVEFVQVEPGQYLFIAANRSVTESVRGNRLNPRESTRLTAGYCHLCVRWQCRFQRIGQ